MSSERAGILAGHKSDPRRANDRAHDIKGSTPPMSQKLSSPLPTQGFSLSRTAPVCSPEDAA